MDMFEQPTQARRPWNQGDGLPSDQGAPGVSRPGYVRAAGRARVTRPDLLARSIETDIVPRLLLSRLGAVRPQSPVAPPPAVVTADDVQQFAELVLGDDRDAIATFVLALRTRGAQADSLFLNLLGPTALLLGKFWEDDTCSFADVTLGMLRLSWVMQELIPVFHTEVAPRPERRRALLVPAPGEQHGLGLKIVTEFMRRAGWQVWCGVPESRQSLLDMVHRDWFALVGFSTACSNRLESLSTAVRLVRRASLNAAVGVMVGGPIFIDHPELAAAVGADATAIDGRHAAQQAENVLDLMPSRG
jgi:methanogenic corrinoid protein MtbC1